MQREGQARQGCLKRVCPKFRKDAKQIKHTQTLTLRKASGIVRMRNRISTHRRSPYEKDNVIVRTPNHIGTLTLVLRKIIQYNKTHRRDVNLSLIHI